MMFGGYGNGMGFGWFGMIIPILFIAGIVYLVVYMTRRDDRGSNERHAEQILAERYARGEISQEEYERMKSVLRK